MPTSSLLLQAPFGLECFWFLLLAMLIPLLLGLLLGYWIWHAYRDKARQLESEKQQIHSELNQSKTELASLKYDYDELKKDNQALRSSINSLEGDVRILKSKLEQAGIDPEPLITGQQIGKAVASSGALPDFAAIFGRDNLQIVEGIGPKIESVLKEKGVDSWAALASQSPEDLRQLLTQANPNYRIHDPSSWPQQARLAEDGQWRDLIAFQKVANSNALNPEDNPSPAKVEKMAARMLGFSADPENLRVVEGVGPKIEQLLKDAGITNWTLLSQTKPERLSEILAEAGDRYRLADPSTWPRQAELAAAGKWQELADYQDYLQGGKDPG